MRSEPPFLCTADGRRPRVAVVDGNTTSAMVTLMLAEQFGCAGVGAPTGEAALALLRQGDRIDLVVLDLAIPDMDGIVAAQLIRTLGARGAVPIVALTDARERVATTRGRAVGFAASLLKPYSPRELFQAMSTALARRPAEALSTRN